MPKLKTHSGTKDRVKLSKNGKARVGSARMNHFLQKKRGSRKRRLRGLSTINKSAAKTLRLKLGA